MFSNLETSGTATAENGHHPEKRWTNKLEALLGMQVRNHSWNGAKTADFIGTGEHIMADYLADWQRHRALYALIKLGLNETDTGVFEANTRTLIQMVRDRGATPILLTNIAVDYPDHYTTDRNVEIDTFDNVYRSLAIELGVGLVDVNAAAKAEIAGGTWDHRVRADLKTLDDSLDDDQPEPWASDGEPASWYTDIHLNEAGSVLYASEIADYFGGL